MKIEIKKGRTFLKASYMPLKKFFPSLNYVYNIGFTYTNVSKKQFYDIYCRKITIL